MDPPPKLDKDDGERLIARLRVEMENIRREIELFESGTVEFVEKPLGGRTSVNKYTTARLYRDLEYLRILIEDLEKQLEL